MLSKLEINELSNFWKETALFEVHCIPDLETGEPEKIKAWLFSSLMKSIRAVIIQFGLPIDIFADLKSIRRKQEKSEKAMYLMTKFHQLTLDFNFKKQHFGLRKWASWPKTMVLSNYYNCVAASMIGFYFMKEIGQLEIYFGFCTRHVINIIKLPNGQWVYSDVNNNLLHFMEIEEMIESENRRIITINIPRVFHQHIILGNPEDISSSVFANLQTVKEIGKNREGTLKQFQPIEIESAKTIYAVEKRNLNSVNIDMVRKSLYPEILRIRNLPLIKEEDRRVAELQTKYRPQ